MMFMNGTHMITQAFALSSPVSTVHAWNTWDHDPPFGDKSIKVIFLELRLGATKEKHL